MRYLPYALLLLILIAFGSFNWIEIGLGVFAVMMMMVEYIFNNGEE